MQVSPDAYVRLDDGAPTEDDVLRAVDLGFARDFVAGLLFEGGWLVLGSTPKRGEGMYCFNVFASNRFGRHCYIVKS